jgi:large subunit ribosomal protein L7Ae
LTKFAIARYHALHKSLKVDAAAVEKRKQQRRRKAKKPAAAAAKPAAAKAGAKGKRPASVFHKEHAHLFPKAPRNYGIGRAVQHSKDLSRFVKWPRYVRIQRQRRILTQRLKVPPSIAQFARTLDKATATELFRLLDKYRTESRTEKLLRRRAAAKAKAGGKQDKTKKPVFVKFGINHVTQLVEDRKAQLVIIAHDVNPIEIVVWLPALCRKVGIPYCIVKSKSRLGALCHKKTATAVAITAVRPADQGSLAKVIDAVKANFNDRYDDIRRLWGGGVMGPKSQAAMRKRAAFRAREDAKRVAV